MLPSSLWIRTVYNLYLCPFHLQKACLEKGQYIRCAVRTLPGSACVPYRTTLQLSCTVGDSGGVRYELSVFSTLSKNTRKVSRKHGNCPAPGLQRKKSCRWRARSALSTTLQAQKGEPGHSFLPSTFSKKTLWQKEQTCYFSLPQICYRSLFRLYLLSS